MRSLNEILDSDGLLTARTHLFTKQEFLDLFCSAGLPADHHGLPRSHFYKPFLDIHEWAQENGATSIVVGGSFVSSKPDPSDIDLLIFFKNSSDVPKSIESFYVDGVLLDIQLLAEDEPDIKAAFLELLSTTRSGIRHGIAQISLNSRVIVHRSPSDRSDAFEIVKASYLGRKHIQIHSPKGLVVPIHGIRTHADWISNITLLASTSGWAVAPFYYGYQDVFVLGDNKEKDRIVEMLREWLSSIRLHWDGPISIIAHSFGTYITARYLLAAKDVAPEIDAIIFCGSIVRANFDWDSILDSASVGVVLNTISEADEYVKFMPEGGMPLLARDTLFGKSGNIGFESKHPRLRQISSKLLAHNNIFKPDVILGQWLPFLRLARGSQYRGKMELLKRKSKNGEI
jgi:pimeloyl-ACP methyl ester carboxylesterase